LVVLYIVLKPNKNTPDKTPGVFALLLPLKKRQNLERGRIVFQNRVPWPMQPAIAAKLSSRQMAGGAESGGGRRK
jgi:hypothetical protein